MSTAACGVAELIKGSADPTPAGAPRIHFVTGRLAEHLLREVLARLAPQAKFEYSVQVMGITVAALMSHEWIAKRIQAPVGTSRVILPGHCQGDVAVVAAAAGVPVETGPKDVRDLFTYFGQQGVKPRAYGTYDIEILAEINHAPRMTRDEIVLAAERLAAEGADLIDVGCVPGETWRDAGEVVRALRDAGRRVSIDSLNPREIEPAVRAGAELVLSVNSSNRDAAVDWGCEVVVIPDDPHSLAGFDETIERLATRGVRMRLDPVLEPIGFGFARSLGRYLQVRDRYPDAEMLMGVGNLTELTDADSAGINVLLLGFCQELGIRGVLTTQVINWARTSVRECDLARRLAHYAIHQRALPKHVEPRLVMLRDARLVEHGHEGLERLSREIKDSNFRLFAERGKLHLVSAGLHLEADDPFELFHQLEAARPKPLDSGHVFYLGYELAKAATALALGKDYRQDQALDWGMLTVDEKSHRGRRGGA